ncbi:MAG: hypothetical protein ABIM99_02335 [Candidatus Dojkabacteria bacterium]
MKTFLHTEINSDKSSAFTKLYSWRSPERYWVQRDRAWFTLYTIFFLIVILIGVLIKEFVFILAVLAFAFLWFINAIIPPQISEHTITTVGIRAFGKLYRWKTIKHFWFSERDGVVFLHLDTLVDEKKALTKRVSLILDDKNQDKEIFVILIRFLDFGEKEEISYNYFTNFTDGEYYPLERYLPEDEIAIMHEKKGIAPKESTTTKILNKIPGLNKDSK